MQPTSALSQAANYSAVNIFAKMDWFSIFIQVIQYLLAFWQLWLMMGAVLAIKFGWSIYQHKKLEKTGIFDIDKMNGSEFEERLGILYENLGFKVTRTGGRPGGDYGVDLIIEKDGERTAIQAKCYKRNRVGEDAVREVNTGKNMYQCYKTQVITNSYYTPMAWRLAKANHVWLYDRKGLIKILLLEKAIKDKIQKAGTP